MTRYTNRIIEATRICHPGVSDDDVLSVFATNVGMPVSVLQRALDCRELLKLWAVDVIDRVGNEEMRRTGFDACHDELHLLKNSAKDHSIFDACHDELHLLKNSAKDHSIPLPFVSGYLPVTRELSEKFIRIFYNRIFSDPIERVLDILQCAGDLIEITPGDRAIGRALVRMLMNMPVHDRDLDHL